MNSNSVEELTEGYFRWRCRRGMKELDFILNRYLDSMYKHMSDETKMLFNDFLEEQDMLLWYWLSGKQLPDGKHQKFAQLVSEICAAGYHKK